MLFQLSMTVIFAIFCSLKAHILATENMHKDLRVAIIGAGLAGLTTAYRLNEKGYDVEVFEARPRVGGRVHSALIQNFEGSFSVAELGGQNISDGGEAYHFISLAKEFDLEVIEDEHEFSRLYFDGTTYHDPTILITANSSQIKQRATMQLENPIHENIQQVLDAIFPDDQILRKIFGLQMMFYEGSPPSNLSLYHNIDTLKTMILGRHQTLNKSSGYKPTLHFVRLKGGNALLPLRLAEKLGGKVHLNCQLSKVSKTESNQISLTFTDGQHKVCDKVIFAIPCPVYEDIIFGPNTIPYDRLKVFSQVSYGSHGKIIVPIQYGQLSHNTFFNDDMYAYFNDDRRLINLYFAARAASLLTSDLDALYKKALQTLSGAITGAILPHMPPIPAREEQLERYSGPVVKSWVDDPYAKGSYCNFSLNSPLIKESIYKGIKVKSIFEPIEDKFYFIGEHTSILEDTGTMEAAVESGVRIASLF